MVVGARWTEFSISEVGIFWDLDVQKYAEKTIQCTDWNSQHI